MYVKKNRFVFFSSSIYLSIYELFVKRESNTRKGVVRFAPQTNWFRVSFLFMNFSLPENYQSAIMWNTLKTSKTLWKTPSDSDECEFWVLLAVGKTLKRVTLISPFIWRCTHCLNEYHMSEFSNWFQSFKVRELILKCRPKSPLWDI